MARSEWLKDHSPQAMIHVRRIRPRRCACRRISERPRMGDELQPELQPGSPEGSPFEAFRQLIESISSMLPSIRQWVAGQEILVLPG